MHEDEDWHTIPHSQESAKRTCAEAMTLFPEDEGEREAKEASEALRHYTPNGVSGALLTGWAANSDFFRSVIVVCLAIALSTPATT